MTTEPITFTIIPLITVDGVPRPARITQWDLDDWAWFKNHPGRESRLRAPIEGEPCLAELPDAAERIAEARQSGFEVAVLVWREGHQFVRDLGMTLTLTA